MDYVDVIARINGIYSLCLLFVGVCSNSLSSITCLKSSELRKNPTFIFVAFLLLSDCVTLLYWNIDHFTTSFYGILLEDSHPAACVVITFGQMSSLQFSAWILVSNRIIFNSLAKILTYYHCRLLYLLIDM